MTKLNNNIKVIPFPKIENAFIVISFIPTDSCNGVQKRMSFFFVNKNGKTGAEWEPDYGPLTKLYSCEKDDPEAQPHWYFDYFTGNQHWSQLAVNRTGINQALLDNNYEEVFRILKQWSN